LYDVAAIPKNARVVLGPGCPIARVSTKSRSQQQKVSTAYLFECPRRAKFAEIAVSALRGRKMGEKSD
jgi:hypothetical protein